ncbi:MAG: YjbQ family protein, partial [Cyanobium sp.]
MHTARAPLSSLSTGGLWCVSRYPVVTQPVWAPLKPSAGAGFRAEPDCLHTSASLTVNENPDPRVLADLAAYAQALVPEEGVRPLSGRGDLRRWVHDDEGPDDMPAH